MRTHRARPATTGGLLCALTLLAAALAAGPPAEAPATIGIDEIERGQRGWGISVFSGSEAERFEVEVLGVLRNISPDSSFILARLSGQGLEETGVIAGMSGSPVYLDGRLAGAVAFSWSFAREAVAGITPIEDMRRMAAGAPAPGQAAAVAPAPLGSTPPVSLAQLAAVDLPPGLLDDAIGMLQPVLAGGARAAIGWTTAGMGPVTGELLGRSLGMVGVGGVGSAEPSAGGGGPAPGGPVGAVLVDGDLRLAAIGTVTDRDGDQLLAFGHPFLGYGPVSIPLAEAEVVTVISNLESSFKVANLGPVVGAFEQDRRPGLQGRVGAVAPTIPLTLKVHGDVEREFTMRLADIPQITPALIATATLSGLEAASYRSGLQGLDLSIRFELGDHGPLVLEQSFDGATAGVESASYVMALSAYLLQNELAEVRLSGVALELEQTASPRTASVVGAHVERTVVRPGDAVRLNVDLAGYRSTPFRHSLDLEIPEDLPAGRYSLLVGDGSSVDVARLAVESAQPVTFPQVLKLLRSFHSRRELVVLGVFAGRGLMVAGQAMPRLPGSVRSLWGAAPSGGAVPLKLAVAQERSERLEVPLSGIVRVDLEVRHREPQLPASGQEGGGDDAPEDSGEVAAAEAEPAPAPAAAGEGGGEA